MHRCCSSSIRVRRGRDAFPCSRRRNARAEFLADATARHAIRAHLGLIAQHFLRADGASWHNQLARDGTPIAPVTPARVLYHLFMAVAEAQRILSQA